MDTDSLRTDTAHAAAGTGERPAEFFRGHGRREAAADRGLLARQSYSVEELATILDLSPATVSHHWRAWSKPGWWLPAAAQHYHVYSLQLQALREMAQQSPVTGEAARDGRRLIWTRTTARSCVNA